MKIPITKYGMPQVIIYPGITLVLMAVTAWCARSVPWVIIPLEFLLAAVLIWMLSFFRDPKRPGTNDKNILMAPADGKVTDIEQVEIEDIPGKALRIGIFLSIFNVHINRAPCEVKVEKITYKKGKFINAMNPNSGKVNESNTVLMTRLDEPQDPLIVKQISGAIARKIVCDTTQGQTLKSCEKFGMIKFGSRTELYIPADRDYKCLVEIGDNVKAALTPLIRYKNA